MFGLNANGQEVFAIQKLTYVPMGRQKSLYTRPYSVTGDPRAADVIVDRVLQSGTSNVSSNMVSDVVSSILMPSSVAYDTTFTESWMDNGHYLFFMEVYCTGYNNITTIYFIQGYTDHQGISTLYGIENATASPQMVHTVSSVIEMGVTQINTPQGMMQHRKIISQYDVVTNETIEGVKLQRPDDIIDNIKTFEIRDRIMSGSVELYPGEFSQSDFITNANNSLNAYSDRVLTSNKFNNMTGDYLSSVINAGVQGRKELEYGVESTSEYDFEYYAKGNRETELVGNRFLKMASRIEGFSIVTNKFTFATIERMSPNIKNDFTLVQNNAMASWDNLNMLPGYDYMSNWNGQDPTSVAAYSLMNGAVSLAAKYGFNYAVINIDNMNSVVRDFDLVISDFSSMLQATQQNTDALVGLLRDKFFHNIYLTETKGGVIPLSCDIYVNLLGDTKIRIQYAGGMEQWKSLSTVLATYTAPTIISNDSLLDHTTNMFSTFISTVGDAFSTQSNNMQGQQLWFGGV